MYHTATPNLPIYPSPLSLQPWVSLERLQEYYKDQAILSIYQDVIKCLLVTLHDDEVINDLEDADQLSIILQAEKLEDSECVWPPWPWPLWNSHKGDCNNSKDCKPTHDPFFQVCELSQQVIRFESDIAEATLDLDKLQQDLHVTITYKPYPSSLSEILKCTHLDVIEAYLVIRAALEYAPNLGTTTEAWKAVRQLRENLDGLCPGAIGERTEFCLHKVEYAMDFVTGRYYVNTTFPGDSREKASESLEHVDWMDEESAQRAEEKAKDPHSLVSYYTLIKIHVDTFFENMLSAASVYLLMLWMSTRCGRNRNMGEWEMTPVTMNAYYNPMGNEIVFPAGILQPHFFSHYWPGYLSYGSFGMVAMHKLMHAFNSASHLYNQQGKLEEWWTRQTGDMYQIRQDCIIMQYSRYTVDDGKGGVIHVNIANFNWRTAGENIGDSGLIQAYQAWKAQYEDSYDAGNKYLLPGLKYTRDQLFFISFAQPWAINNRHADVIQRVHSNLHSPNWYHTDSTIYNIPEFAKAFKCPKNSKLNPPHEERCIFWS
ncbi:hypothetical protein F5141DRAFT_1249521 [Pisolithus sp. B1]|nr:hypothetical protein F5141DRAFT_1249521 [Pisolithus sp. B1]